LTRILADTNILLDVLLNRSPHFAISLDIWLAIDAGLAEGFIAAHAVTTIDYYVRKSPGLKGASRALESILKVFRVAAVDDAVIRQAVRAGSNDFEDTVTAFAAAAAGCNLIVTRDPKGFRDSPVLAVGPAEALELFSA
jgi:predicted nucleic acid-binding protein